MSFFNIYTNHWLGKWQSMFLIQSNIKIVFTADSHTGVCISQQTACILTPLWAIIKRPALSFAVRYIKNLWLYKLCKHLKVIFYLWIQTAALTEEQTAWIPSRNISAVSKRVLQLSIWRAFRTPATSVARKSVVRKMVLTQNRLIRQTIVSFALISSLPSDFMQD